VTLAETIRSNIRRHIMDDNGQLYCQNVSAVGWVGGTVPDDIPDNRGIIELPTSDSSNPGIVCGAALAGRKPIYVIRYQGFMAYNNASLLNYAAKSKTLWNVPCPVFIRAIGMEGGMGPVATGMHHSMAARMPGVKIFAPMTSFEWQWAWNEFKNGDDVVYCSEHRSSFKNDGEGSLWTLKKPDVVIVSIGPARPEASKAADLLRDSLNVTVNVVNLFKVKPLEIPESDLESISKAKVVVVVDGDYQICGLSEHICYKLMSEGYNTNCHALGLEDRTAGFSKDTDNLTPDHQRICRTVAENL
jgi:pyruvate dehydrogenase E1 component beta subunit